MFLSNLAGIWTRIEKQIFMRLPSDFDPPALAAASCHLVEVFRALKAARCASSSSETSFRTTISFRDARFLFCFRTRDHISICYREQMNGRGPKLLHREIDCVESCSAPVCHAYCRVGIRDQCR